MLAAGQGDVPPLRELLIDRMPARVYPPGHVSAYSNYGAALAGYEGHPLDRPVATA